MAYQRVPDSPPRTPAAQEKASRFAPRPFPATRKQPKTQVVQRVIRKHKDADPYQDVKEVVTNHPGEGGEPSPNSRRILTGLLASSDIDIDASSYSGWEQMVRSFESHFAPEKLSVDTGKPKEPESKVPDKSGEKREIKDDEEAEDPILYPEDLLAAVATQGVEAQQRDSHVEFTFKLRVNLYENVSLKAGDVVSVFHEAIKEYWTKKMADDATPGISEAQTAEFVSYFAKKNDWTEKQKGLTTRTLYSQLAAREKSLPRTWGIRMTGFSTSKGKENSLPAGPEIVVNVIPGTPAWGWQLLGYGSSEVSFQVSREKKEKGNSAKVKKVHEETAQVESIGGQVMYVRENNFALDKAVLKKRLAHEFGHLAGLAHPGGFGSLGYNQGGSFLMQQGLLTNAGLTALEVAVAYHVSQARKKLAANKVSSQKVGE